MFEDHYLTSRYCFPSSLYSTLGIDFVVVVLLFFTLNLI